VNYLRIARRFWWLVVAGLAAASLVLVLMVYRVERKWPPLLAKKAVPSYYATTELLVDSPTGPYIRTGTDRPIPVPRFSRSQESSQPTTTTAPTGATPTKALVDAANLFPLFVESDAVARIRIERFGVIPGIVRAKALYAVQGENRYRPSVLPVMQIAAYAQTPRNAVRLAEATARAFGIWLAREQSRAHVPAAQRIVVRQLRVPREAVARSGASYGLPALVAFAVFGAFLGLIVAVDRLLSRRGEQLDTASATGVADEAGQPNLTVASGSHSS
jgi:hypothetical protein